MPKPEIKVIKIHSQDQLKYAHQIRYEVFVIGQNVPEEDEIDGYEDECEHFLAFANGAPCGAARWRITEKGVKLERFAVLDKFRSMGVGSALVKAVQDDILKHSEASQKLQYLHAQLSAMKLYAKFGFKKTGEMFQECSIDHYKMIR